MIETSVFLLHNQIEAIVQYWMSRHHVVVSSLSKSRFLFLVVSVSIFLQIIKISHFILKDEQVVILSFCRHKKFDNCEQLNLIIVTVHWLQCKNLFL